MTNTNPEMMALAHHLRAEEDITNTVIKVLEAEDVKPSAVLAIVAEIAAKLAMTLPGNAEDVESAIQAVIPSIPILSPEEHDQLSECYEETDRGLKAEANNDE